MGLQQTEQEDVENFRELTSRWEIPVQSLLTTHMVASASDNRHVHTLFSTSLYFLILLSLEGPTASISPAALAFCSLSRRALKRAVHTQDVRLRYLHTTTYLLLQKRKGLI